MRVQYFSFGLGPPLALPGTRAPSAMASSARERLGGAVRRDLLPDLIQLRRCPAGSSLDIVLGEVDK